MELRDTFRYSAEIIKAEQDENGDWIVEGIASTSAEDQEGDILVPEGFEYSYFLEKGFIKWEHGKDPKNFIGEPIEARITPKGFYIKGRLYGHSPLARQAVEALQTLQKSNARRKLGYSVEGSVVQRDKKNPKRVLKSIIRNVAMTFNPVNDGTWAALAKSLTSKDSLEFSLATDTPSGAALQPESLEGSPVDNKRKHRKALAQYLLALAKRIRQRAGIEKSMVISLTADDKKGALAVATEGLSPEEAAGLASYIEQRADLLQDIAKSLGGEQRMDKELAKELDTSVEALRKAIEEEDVDAEIESESADEDEMVEGEEEDTEKSFVEGLVSGENGETIEKALEVSTFLETLAGAIGDSIDSFGETLEKSHNRQEQINGALLKAVQDTGTMLKSLNDNLAELRTTVAELANQPVGRKSVQNGREMATLQKSLGDQPQQQLRKSQVVDVLTQAAIEKKIDPMVVTRFELTGQLPESIAKSLNLVQ